MTNAVIERGRMVKARTVAAWMPDATPGNATPTTRSTVLTPPTSGCLFFEHPPLGPPGKWPQEGNSIPPRAPVAAGGKSERVGELGSAK